MAKNPPWHKDVNGSGDDDDTEKGSKSGFDPSSLDGQDVTESLTHAELDAVASHRTVTFSANDLSKADKVKEINQASVV